MSSSVSNANGIVVVTHVYPQQSGSAVPTHSTFPNVSSVLGKFLKREPKVLGTVQIMIAFVMILFGIVLAVYADNISVYSGILFWGSISYISSGALSVAANNKLNRCLVNGALVMNIFSAIIAAIAIIIFSLDFVIELRNYYCSYSYRDTYDHSCERLQDRYQARSQGISGVLLLFSILEFIISICVSAFACNAVCYYPSEQVVYMPYTSTQVNNVTPGDLLIPAQTSFSPSVGENVVGSFDANNASEQTEKPPEYAEVFPSKRDQSGHKHQWTHSHRCLL